MSVLIFSEQRSPRLDYILDFIFNEVMRCSFERTTDIDFFKKSDSPKINYSNLTIADSVQIVPHPLIFETDLKPHGIQCFDWDGKQAFFKTSENVVSFDIFAASFYLISRYEEYLTIEVDEFNRFPHKLSVAFKNKFLELPLIDLWVLKFKTILQAHNANIVFGDKKFQFIPTYDIDIAYSYKHKGTLRNTGGWIGDLLKGNNPLSRINVLLGKEKDPYDAFDELDHLHETYNLNPIYFFLLGRGGALDKNLDPQNPGFKNLIKRIKSKYPVGIHPSFRSNEEPEELNIEIQTLNNIASIQTTKSRQHYIRFSLPETFQRLIAQGITDDYSMGYGSINGFRASTSNPFNWFDVSTNEKTSLRAHPFCFMECNSFFEQKQTAAETRPEIEHYIDTVKKVDGTFISIWHNFSLGSDPLWDGWREVYLYQLILLDHI